MPSMSEVNEQQQTLAGLAGQFFDTLPRFHFEIHESDGRAAKDVVRYWVLWWAVTCYFSSNSRTWYAFKRTQCCTAMRERNVDGDTSRAFLVSAQR
jgi:hypothetical protein